MSEKPLITASIVTYNNTDIAANTAEGLKAYTLGYPFRLFVIDNSSKQLSPVLLNYADKLIKNRENVGFGAAHNRMLSEEMGKYHAVINPDIIVDSDILSAMADVLEQNPDIAIITPKIMNKDGSEQMLPRRSPTMKYIFGGRISKKIRNEYIMADYCFKDITDIDFCTGCFFMIKSEVFRKIGGFDDRYFMYMEDADLTREAKKYGRTVYYPHGYVTHLWERGSAKSLKLLLVHLCSYFKYRKKWKKDKK